MRSHFHRPKLETDGRLFKLIAEDDCINYCITTRFW